MGGYEERCPSCKGVGERRIHAPVHGIDVTEPCKRCGGKGRVPVASEKGPPAAAPSVGEGGAG